MIHVLLLLLSELLILLILVALDIRIVEVGIIVGRRGIRIGPRTGEVGLDLDAIVYLRARVVEEFARLVDCVSFYERRRYVSYRMACRGPPLEASTRAPTSGS